MKDTPHLQSAPAFKAHLGATSRMLRKEFPHLKRMPALWTPSYFVSSAGNVSAATMERYIAEQTTRG